MRSKSRTAAGSPGCAVLVFTLLVTWKRGRDMVLRRLRETALPLAPFVTALLEDPPLRVPGTAIFMTPMPTGCPRPAAQPQAQQGAARACVILNVRYAEVPYVPADDQLEMMKLAEGFYHVSSAMDSWMTSTFPRPWRNAPAAWS